MPVIRISEGTFERLQHWARPLVDSADDALARVLSVAEEHQRTIDERSASPGAPASQPDAAAPTRPAPAYQPTSVARSRRYELPAPFEYWWTVSPARKGEIEKSGRLVLVQKDTGHQAVVRSQDILPLLTPDRQAPNRRGWDLQLLRDAPDRVAVVQPDAPQPGWSRLTVRWEEPSEDATSAEGPRAA